ncbi:MAG TPA: hypothetical protein VEA78_11790 [Acidimicrobiales bacterium]|nr:hypothetical protein [Acidimicrobiales bacterium]
MNEHVHVADLVVEEERQQSVFLLPILAAALILALIGVIGVATKGDAKVDDPLALLGAAPAALEDAGSARMTMSFTFDGGGIDMSFDAQGAMEFATGATVFTMELFGETMEMRTDGETLWMRMPPSAQVPGVEGEWIAMPFDELTGGAALRQQVPGLGGTSYFDALLGVNDDIEDLGAETVNGVETRHYAFTVDITAATEQLPADQRAEMEAAFADMGSDLTAVPVEAWLSDDGVPVRQVITVDVDEDGMVGTMRMQMDLSDFGVEVDVRPPPAEDIISFDEVPGLEDAILGSEAA